MCASEIKVTIIFFNHYNFSEVQIGKRILKTKDDGIDQVRVNLWSSAMKK